MFETLQLHIHVMNKHSISGSVLPYLSWYYLYDYCFFNLCITRRNLFIKLKILVVLKVVSHARTVCSWIIVIFQSVTTNYISIYMTNHFGSILPYFCWWYYLFVYFFPCLCVRRDLFYWIADHGRDICGPKSCFHMPTKGPFGFQLRKQK